MCQSDFLGKYQVNVCDEKRGRGVGRERKWYFSFREVFNTTFPPGMGAAVSSSGHCVRGLMLFRLSAQVSFQVPAFARRSSDLWCRRKFITGDNSKLRQKSYTLSWCKFVAPKMMNACTRTE